MGRKRNQGKARKAAKAKAAREEETEEESGNNNQQLSAGQVRPMTQSEDQAHLQQCKCRHGFNPHSEHICIQFIRTFRIVFFNEYCQRGSQLIATCLEEARKATWDKYAEVWNDSAKMKIAMSYLLCMGTMYVLEGTYDIARRYALYVRYLEQYIAVKLKQTQALINMPKIEDTYHADDHTLVKFFRHRIPCSCLDEKYQEVKHIPKRGCCYNPQCGREVERSKTMYCSRCRCITYCSRECHIAAWTEHKPYCDINAEIIAKFEDRQRNV